METMRVFHTIIRGERPAGEEGHACGLRLDAVCEGAEGGAHIFYESRSHAFVGSGVEGSEELLVDGVEGRPHAWEGEGGSSPGSARPSWRRIVTMQRGGAWPLGTHTLHWGDTADPHALTLGDAAHMHATMQPRTLPHPW